MADKQGVLGTLTMDDLSALRRLSGPDAEMFLARHSLTDDERGRANQLIGRDRPAESTENIVQVHDPMRGLWMMAAWLAGASWRQLARYHNIAPQTVMAIGDRKLTSVERQSQRLRPRMSLEALETYHKSFTAHIVTLQTLTPREVAQWLLDNTELDNE